MTEHQKMKFEYSVEEIMYNKNIAENVFLSQDYVDNTGQKRYTSMTILDWKDNINKLLSTNSFFYELIPKNSTHMKLFFDIDMEVTESDEEKKERLLGIFIQFLCDQILFLYEIELIRDDFIILDSSRKEKISFHIILQNKICFLNMKIMKDFIQYLNEVIKKQKDDVREAMTWKRVKKTGTGEEEKCFWDMNVYSRTQNFRLINQSKRKDGATTLKCYDKNITAKDTFIGLYEGSGDRQVINDSINVQRELKIKNKSIECITRHKMKPIPSSRSEFKLEGDTLQKKKNISFADLRKKPEYIQYLYLIPNGDEQPRTIFLHVGFAIRGAGGTMGDYYDWAKMSRKFDEGRTVKTFNTFSTTQLGLEYLRLRAKASCEEYFDSGLLRFRRYFNPDFKNLRIIEENSRYISDILLDRKEQLILLDSPLGSGKTTAIKKLIKYNNYKRVLIIAPRITFSQYIASDMETELYLNEKVDLCANKLTISMESLYKVKGKQNPQLLILDETEALLSIFDSPTLKDRRGDTYNYLVSLILSAKKVIFAGAFITQATIDFINHFKKSKICIRNIYQPIEKKAICIPTDKFILRLEDSIVRGEKNYIVYSSFTAQQSDIGMLQGSKSDHVKEVMKGALNYSKNSDGKMITDLKKQEEVWNSATLVSATPTITVGNSYDPKNADFHNIFIRASPTCIVADTFQAHFRVRKTINNQLIYSLPDKKILRLQSNAAKSGFILLDKYDIISKQRKTIHENAMYNAFWTLIKEPGIIDKNEMKSINDIMIIFNEKEEYPEMLEKILMYKLEEKLLSQAYYEPMFDYFLEKLNYKKDENDDIITKEDEKRMEDLNDNKVDKGLKYIDIEEIEEYQKDELVRLQGYKKTTYVENQQISKYIFQVYMDKQKNEEVCAFYYDQFITTHKNEKFLNGRCEMQTNLLQAIIDHKGETISNRIHKCQIIHKLDELLGLQSSYEKKILERKDIENTISYLKKNEMNIRNLFSMTMKKKEFEFKYSVEFIRSIYKSWNDCTMKAIKDVHKKVIAYEFLCLNVFINEDDVVIPPFEKMNYMKIMEVGKVERLKIDILTKKRKLEKIEEANARILSEETAAQNKRRLIIEENERKMNIEKITQNDKAKKGYQLLFKI